MRISCVSSLFSHIIHWWSATIRNYCTFHCFRDRTEGIFPGRNIESMDRNHLWIFPISCLIQGTSLGTCWESEDHQTKNMSVVTFVTTSLTVHFMIYEGLSQALSQLLCIHTYTVRRENVTHIPTWGTVDLREETTWTKLIAAQCRD